jgi:hypothetical protein
LYQNRGPAVQKIWYQLYKKAGRSAFEVSVALEFSCMLRVAQLRITRFKVKQKKLDVCRNLHVEFERAALEWLLPAPPLHLWGSPVGGS